MNIFPGHKTFLTSDNIQLSEPKNALQDGYPAAVRPFLEASLSANTRRAYRNDLAHFIVWGGTIPSGPETVARYLAEHAHALSVATLSRRIVAISKAHTMRGHANPAASDLVRMTMRGIRRTLGKPQRQAAAAVKEDVITMVAGLGPGLKALRDRALILIGFAGAFRRSELVGITCEDIQRVPQGIIVTLRRSKTDQEGEGRKVGIPYARGAVCPVRALDEWLAASAINDGAVFRPVDRHSRITDAALSGEAVAAVVKERALAAGLDPSRYSGHSLRAGLATSAAAAGVSAWKIKQQTGHVSDAMLARYIRDGDLFRNNALIEIL